VLGLVVRAINVLLLVADDKGRREGETRTRSALWRALGVYSGLRTLLRRARSKVRMVVVSSAPSRTRRALPL